MMATWPFRVNRNRLLLPTGNKLDLFLGQRIGPLMSSMESCVNPPNDLPDVPGEREGL